MAEFTSRVEDHSKSMTRFEKWSFTVEVAGVVALIATLAVTSYFLVREIRSLEQQTRSTQSQAELAADSMNNSIYQALTNQRAEMDRMFVEYPELRAPFYESEGVGIVEENSSEADRLYALAELKLHYLDSYLLQARSLSSSDQATGAQEEEFFDEEAFDDYIAYSFDNSPLLCEYLAAQQTRYSEALNNKVKSMEVCPLRLW